MSIVYSDVKLYVYLLYEALSACHFSAVMHFGLDFLYERWYINYVLFPSLLTVILIVCFDSSQPHLKSFTDKGVSYVDSMYMFQDARFNQNNNDPRGE